MDLLFEVVLQLVGELLLQLVGEILFELGFHSMAEVRKKPFEAHPAIATFGYVLWGALLGFISYFPFPNSFIHSSQVQIFNLIASPIIVGLVMVKIGEKRIAREENSLRIHRFSYGFLMAFTFGLVRWSLVG